MSTNKVLSANIQFTSERYSYHVKFNMENIGQYRTYLKYDDNLLDAPVSVYKYFGRNTNSLNSLKENYLYFSDPRKFNDPFDCLVNRENFIVANKANMQKHRDNIGVCSFSMINDNPLMWGHYANCFSGFCLKIKNNLKNNGEIAVLGHVAYLEDYNGSNETLKRAINNVNGMTIESYEKNTIQTALKILYEYCWKFHDWKYEKEYRAVSINALNFDRKFYYEKNQIEEIYIGYRMQLYYPTYYKNFMKIIKKYYSHVNVYEVKPHPIKVKLEFTQI